jgi:abortive infection bacteriophage resistance protein
MRYDKLPLTFEQQLALLISRGLEVDDHELALHVLERIGYYRLSAYWHPVKNHDDSFRPGAKFEVALQLYEFDRQLRLLVIDAIERVEIALRTAITYNLAQAYGSYGHTEPGNFRNDFHHAAWAAKVERDTKSSREDFIAHFQAKYQDYPSLPIWMTTEVITLGALSRLYEGMLKRDQQKIARDYGIHPVVLRTWLRTLTYIRNLCAHHARLWNRQIPVAPDLPRHDARWQPPLTPTNRRLFAILLVLRQMMHHHHQGEDWQQRVTELIAPIAQKDYRRIAMGMPQDWQQHPLWNRAVPE